MNEDFDHRLRNALFSYLELLSSRCVDGTVKWSELNEFRFEGRVVNVIGMQGIWTPSGLDTAISITTTYTPPDKKPPYADIIGSDGLIRYKYKGTNPEDPANLKLRRALVNEVGLVYFIGVAKGIYLPVWPVWIVGEDTAKQEFLVVADNGLKLAPELFIDSAWREYAQRIVKARLHQPMFRSRVLRAYNFNCAICQLRHGELLDAAHILPDSHPHGDPIVPNGLALCKIHHAAYDRNIIGIRPDLRVEVKAGILEEVDGPMLLHGIQEMHGIKITIPRSSSSKPDPERLEARYELFRSVS